MRSAPRKKTRIPKPQGYHHGDLQRALLIAARQMVDEGGAQALTLRGAAQKAGVSAAAPYRHFTDRDALLAAVITEGFDELTAATEAARAAAGDPVSAYLAVGEAYLGFAAVHPSLYRLMFGIECHKPDYPALLEAGQRAFGVVLRAAQDCGAAGLIGTRPPEQVALAGWTMVHGLASLHVDGVLSLVLPVPLPDAAAALFSILTEGVRPR
ncbi:MAG: TetR/AcrR family transcriptional regulator [Xanthomonadaceae bacterium]|nr:TetR/AcrR family transcriptional regulator [Xanthomonadaceae bacterium]